jgi:hypothetical protein
MSSVSKSVAAFVATALVAVPAVIAGATDLWALLAPFLTGVVTYLAPKNKP